MAITIHTLSRFETHTGYILQDFEISYEIFGKPLHTAPLVVVVHALTGNSDVVSHENGWWKTLVGYGKVIDLEKYTVLSFNIPGNGYSGKLIHNYKDFNAKDIAKLFNEALVRLGISQVYAVVGGSLGGGIAWEMNVLQPHFFKYLIPVASDWKSTDWVIAQCKLQENALLHSDCGLQDARKIAMMFYRTPESFTERFKRTKTELGKFNVVSWLDYHGDKLENRFTKEAYLMMNHLLASINITSFAPFYESVKDLKSEIIQIGVDSDLLFISEENINTKAKLDKMGIKNQYFEIQSIHGHDAFLIEFDQLSEIMKPYFNSN